MVRYYNPHESAIISLFRWKFTLTSSVFQMGEFWLYMTCALVVMLLMDLNVVDFPTGVVNLDVWKLLSPQLSVTIFAVVFYNNQCYGRYMRTALGSLLFTLLDGAALRAFDSVSMDDIEADGGHQIIYEVLDGRFPEEAVHDRLGEVMDGIFDLRVERGESTSVFTGKARSAFAAAEARSAFAAAEVEGVKFPDVARGYLLMRFARLSAEKRAIVLAASRQSYSEADVASALRTTFPEGLYTGKVTSMVAPVEMDEPFFPEDEQVPEDDEVFATEGVNLDDLGDDPIEEQDAVDILMTWKQTRGVCHRGGQSG
eukprot:s4010_g2.t1